MAAIDVKRFASADETRKFKAHGQLDLLTFEDMTVGCARFEPGWRWSEDVKPVAGTKSCEVEHFVYVISGRMRVRMDDGKEADLKPGDMAHIEPGHDGWVVGTEPCVCIDFLGAATYAQDAAKRQRKPEAATAAMH